MKITRSSKFKKDYKLAQRQQRNIKLLHDIIEKLARREKLPPKIKDHELKGKLKQYRELHVEPDLLLIYQINDELKLIRLGSHSNLYKK